jgi:hypothetical protein
VWNGKAVVLSQSLIKAGRKPVPRMVEFYFKFVILKYFGGM